MYLGVALAKLDDVDNACAAYQRAISMSPEEPIFYLNYGEKTI
jgi:Bardet-Biedl syndrome 4 protein